MGRAGNRWQLLIGSAPQGDRAAPTLGMFPATSVAAADTGSAACSKAAAGRLRHGPDGLWTAAERSERTSPPQRFARVNNCPAVIAD